MLYGDQRRGMDGNCIHIRTAIVERNAAEGESFPPIGVTLGQRSHLCSAVVVTQDGRTEPIARISIEPGGVRIDIAEGFAAFPSHER